MITRRIELENDIFLYFFLFFRFRRWSIHKKMLLMIEDISQYFPA